MVKGDFGRSKCSKPIRFSGGHFCFVVETLDDTAGDLLSRAEPVEQEFSGVAELSLRLCCNFGRWRLVT